MDPEQRKKLIQLTWSDITFNGVINNREYINDVYGTSLSQQNFTILRNIFIGIYRKRNIEAGNGQGLRQFMHSFKKGSKPFRLIIYKTKKNKLLPNQGQVKTFFEDYGNGVSRCDTVALAIY